MYWIFCNVLCNWLEIDDWRLTRSHRRSLISRKLVCWLIIEWSWKKNKWSFEVETEKKHLFFWSACKGCCIPVYVCTQSIDTWIEMYSEVERKSWFAYSRCFCIHSVCNSYTFVQFLAGKLEFFFCVWPPKRRPCDTARP